MYLKDNLCGDDISTTIITFFAQRSTSLSTLLIPIQQTRKASILGALSDNKGAYNKRIRRGRGPSSRKGGTSGRGQHGQKAHGKVPRGFEGGQTPLAGVKGLRGFENQYVLFYEIEIGF